MIFNKNLKFCGREYKVGTLTCQENLGRKIWMFPNGVCLLQIIVIFQQTLNDDKYFFKSASYINQSRKRPRYSLASNKPLPFSLREQNVRNRDFPFFVGC